MMSTGAVYTVDTVGIFYPKKVPVTELNPGEVGYITAAIHKRQIVMLEIQLQKIKSLVMR